MALSKKIFGILIIQLFIINLISQTAPNKYWIQFIDKNNSPYSINQAEEFLSQRSIERRLRYNIAIDELDFPVNSHYLDSLRHYGLVVLTTSKWHNGATVFASDTNVMSSIRQLDFVQNVRKNANVTPNRVPKENANLHHFSPINNSIMPEIQHVQNKEYDEF
ncbi:MAG: hypothetical protein PHI36_10765, partial [Bacteroidales bacterium]|nr:hypothetical protein [Bacteroidales bacterium]